MNNQTTEVQLEFMCKFNFEKGLFFNKLSNKRQSDQMDGDDNDVNNKSNNSLNNKSFCMSKETDDPNTSNENDSLI